MARTARAIVGGCCYHVLSRGNNRGTVFHDEGDYSYFVSLVTRAQRRVRIELLAACLMPNHVHFVLRPAGKYDISRWAHWLLTTHVKHHHAKYGSVGRVFGWLHKAGVAMRASPSQLTPRTRTRG